MTLLHSLVGLVDRVHGERARIESGGYRAGISQGSDLAFMVSDSAIAPARSPGIEEWTGPDYATPLLMLPTAKGGHEVKRYWTNSAGLVLEPTARAPSKRQSSLRPEGRAMMLLSRLAAGTTFAAVVLMTVTACGGSSSNSSQAAGKASQIASAVSAAQKTAAPTSAGSVAVGSTASSSGESSSAGPSFVSGGAALANTDALVTVLEAVNPKVGTSKDDLVAKSKALCTKLNANESEAQLEADAAKGFTNGSWVPSDSEAQAIVGTVKAYGGC
jgi:hypothetical protein